MKWLKIVVLSQLVTWSLMLAGNQWLTAHAQEKSQVAPNEIEAQSTKPSSLALGPWIEKHCVAVLPNHTLTAGSEKSLQLRCDR